MHCVSHMWANIIEKQRSAHQLGLQRVRTQVERASSADTACLSLTIFRAARFISAVTFSLRPAQSSKHGCVEAQQRTLKLA